MERLVNLHAAKTHLSRLVDEAAAGETIVLARHGRPVAKLVAYTRAAGPRRFGGLRGKIWIADDFDETPQWLLDAFEGKDNPPELWQPGSRGRRHTAAGKR